MIGNAVAGIYGTGAPPIPPSSYESIATTTLTTSSFSFTSIAQTYKHLQIRGYFIPNTAGYTPYVRYNGANGTYAHQLFGNGATATATATATFMNVALSGGIQDTYPFAFIIDVQDYSNSTRNKTFRAFLGQEMNSSDGQVVLASGFKNDTTAITQLGITFGIAGNGLAALYGIKG